MIREPWEKADLASLGIKKDAVLPEGIDFTHRTAEGADIYFMSNQTGKQMTFKPVFRAERAYRYLADAVTGKVYNAGESVTLPAGGSLFYILSDDAVPAKLTAMPTQSTTLTTLDKTNGTSVSRKRARRLRQASSLTGANQPRTK